VNGADRVVNVLEMRELARRRLPRPVFDIIEGGADDEISLRDNRRAFERIQFRPRPLADVASRDLSIDLFGLPLASPVCLAPTGAARLVHPRAELEVARAADAAGALYVQATGTSFPLDEVAAAGGDALWFQLYTPARSADTAELDAVIAGVWAAGYRALALTIDTAVTGNRERDRRNRIAVPYRIRPRHVADALVHPRWTSEFLRGNIGSGIGRTGYMANALKIRALESRLSASIHPVTWDDLRRVRALWPGPLLVKGIMRPDECPRLIGEGVDGIIVSNHGGRQLDGVPATVEVLPSVVEAVAGQVPVLLDGGIRRGADVVKAVALGARAVFIGRPYLYGLAAAGGAGVQRVLRLLAEEIDITMALLGCASLADVTPDLIRTPGASPVELARGAHAVSAPPVAASARGGMTK
jgi:isopentenyl diphosphate isomerase/L-lactate dehydrogenase-like FMN-dependent dehydrogenase